ncbi:MAG: hypothetical protein QM737_06460 [Ferruginibacter sp.]
MATISGSRLKLAIGIPALIFLACTIISFSSKFKEQPDKFSLAILIDLLITAPLAYYLLIRGTAVSKMTVLRIFMAGILVAGLLLRKNDSQVLSFIKLWISPAVEISLVSFIIWKFYTAKKSVRINDGLSFDFLVHCRAVLRSVFGNEKAANIMAAEIAVFYYAFCKKEKDIPGTMRFTSYKENGIILIMGTFLCLFIIETIGMHFVFQLWSNTAAWILTVLSFYTCVQLFSHIRALKLRAILLSGNELFIRNGLLGGDTTIAIDNIERIIKTNKAVEASRVVKIGLFNVLEKNNVAIYLKEPVTVIKAFGMKKDAKIVVMSVDGVDGLISSVVNQQSAIGNRESAIDQ